jgi:hypothetical protein
MFGVPDLWLFLPTRRRINARSLAFSSNTPKDQCPIPGFFFQHAQGSMPDL